MIQIHVFKKKRKEGGKGRPYLGGQWKVSSLVAFRRFHAWLFLKGEGEASFSSPSIFHPINFYLNFFSL
jgi:hypothetical protein